ILDANGNPVPIGQPGEIYIGGDCVSAGYHKLPELTAKHFVKDIFSEKEDALMYRSGDLGKYLPNGEILYLGRIDQQVKIRGLRIELEEIRYNILQQDGIRDAAVLVNESAAGDKQLIAYVVPDGHEYKTSDDNGLHLIDISLHKTATWKNALQELMPSYMVPSVFFGISGIHLTINDKINQHKLLE